MSAPLRMDDRSNLPRQAAASDANSLSRGSLVIGSSVTRAHLTRVCALMGLALAIAWSGSAQEQPANRAAGRKNRDQVEYLLQFTARKVLAVAEAMPAEKYGFTPTGGEFTGVRSFREQLKHVAADNYLDGAALLGDRIPPGNLTSGENGSVSVTTKPEVIAYLKDSFDYLHHAVQIMDDGNAPLRRPDFLPYGPATTSRLLIMLANIGHTNDHYGQLVEYLRMNGIVPPASRASSGTGTGNGR